MPIALLIQPLSLNLFDPAQLPTAPGFSQTVNDELGDVATDADGFVAAFSDGLALLDSLDAALTVLGGDLGTTFTEAEAIDPTALDDVAAPPAADLSAADAAVDELGTLLGQAPTTPAPAPTPPGPSPSPTGMCPATQDDIDAQCGRAPDANDPVYYYFDGKGQRFFNDVQYRDDVANWQLCADAVSHQQFPCPES